MKRPKIITDFNHLSKEAQEVAKGMIEYCIEGGERMGMDEGFTKDNRKRSFRKQLESFCGMNPETTGQPAKFKPTPTCWSSREYNQGDTQ
jgi:hypothetical protein